MLPGELSSSRHRAGWSQVDGSTALAPRVGPSRDRADSAREPPQCPAKYGSGPEARFMDPSGGWVAGPHEGDCSAAMGSDYVRAASAAGLDHPSLEGTRR